MPYTAEQFFDLDMSFPGFSFGYESWALESYLDVLDEQIEHAKTLYRDRAESALESEKDSLEHNEYGYRLSEIDEATETQIPRFFRIGAVISIWGLFESFLTDFALYVGKKECIGLSFKDIRADNFRKQIEKYFEKVARIDIPWSNEEREKLGQLQDLRNFLAHRNGRLTDLPQDAEKKIRDLSAKIPSITIEDGKLVISAEYVISARALVFDTVARFSQLLADRYAPQRRNNAQPQ